MAEFGTGTAGEIETDAAEPASERSAEQPIKRPRGRPRGSGKGGSASRKIDPAEFSAGRPVRKTGQERQKTGFQQRRQAAEGRNEKDFVSIASDGVEAVVKAAPVDPNAAKQIAETLLMMNNMAATVLSLPEFALAPEEGEMLGLATAGVARHYKWSGMAEKTKDWLMLLAAMSMIYEPRFRAVRNRVRASRQPMRSQTKNESAT